MKFLFVLISFCIFGGQNINAQDTIFSKTEKDYRLIFKKSGYHIHALLHKNNTERIDTVFRYDYGAYKGMKVKDAAVHDNIFMCVYRSMNGLFFINSAFKDEKWSPILGGYLFFFAQGEKDDYRVSIISKEKVVIRQGEKGKKNIYLYDYNKKTVKVLGKE